MKTKLVLAAFLLATACGGDDDGGTEVTLQSCVTDHVAEALTEVEAITECLGDELALSFATQAECETYVTANGGYEASRTAGCEGYFEEFGPDAAPGGDPDGGGALPDSAATLDGGV